MKERTGDLAATVPVEGTVIAERVVEPNEIDLFMFSAVTWLTHRIHYDREYAKGEGYDDILIHGPLQGAYLSQMLADFADGLSGRLVPMEYHHHRAAFCHEALRCAARVKSVGRQQGVLLLTASVEIVNRSGLVVTSGSAAIELNADTDLADLARDRRL